MNEPLRFVFIDGDDNRNSFEASSVSSSASIYSADDLGDVVELRAASALRRATSAYDSVSASIYDAVDASLGVVMATAPLLDDAQRDAAAADGYTDRFEDTIPMFELEEERKKEKKKKKKKKIFRF
jgi:hypothetical protein